MQVITTGDASLSAARRILDRESHKTPTPEQLNVRYDNLFEKAKPKNTPAVALQTYEYFDGNKKHREAVKKAFISGETDSLGLDYPKLSADYTEKGRSVDESVADLEYLMQECHELISGYRLYLNDSYVEEKINNLLILKDSIEFRLMEAYYLKVCVDLNSVDFSEPLTKETQDLINLHSLLASKLYGEIIVELKDQILGEVAYLVGQKDLSPGMKEIFDQVNNGEFGLPTGLLSSGSNKRLPAKLDRETLNELQHSLMEMYSKEYEVIEQYYADHINPNDEEDGSGGIFSPKDIFGVFKDLNLLSGNKIDIIFDEHAKATAWSTSRGAIIVGGLRAPIENINEVLALWVHEYGVHAKATLRGREIHPSFEAGVYVPFSIDFFGGKDVEASDYLTYEEGLGSVLQGIISKGENFAEWSAADLEKALVVALAQHYGLNHRQIFEIIWRIRALLTCKPNQEMNEAEINKCKNASYTSLVRIFRGTPSSQICVDADGRVLVHTKDLTYLFGKKRVFKDLGEAIDDGIAIEDFIDCKLGAGRIDLGTATGPALELAKKVLKERSTVA